jgi:RNA polymerase sigma factor (sigma-70 family)
VDNLRCAKQSLVFLIGRLEEFDARKSKIVEMRFFAGLSIDETAEVLGVSPGTIMRDWTLAKAWLRRELSV